MMECCQYNGVFGSWRVRAIFLLDRRAHHRGANRSNARNDAGDVHIDG